MKRIFAYLTAFLCATTAAADSITFKSGNSFDCTILKDDVAVTVLYRSGVMRIPHTDLSDFKRDAPAKPAASDKRLPDLTAVLVKLAARKWADKFQQIPATVIDTGIMRNVPYKSFRAGTAYEINVYGDPQSPSGFEIGVRGALLSDDKAKASCVEFICSLLSDSTDIATVKALKLEKDLVTRKELTFEITPPTAEDAYGGWWVSVYSEPSLNSVRATTAELNSITVPKAAVAQSARTSGAVLDSDSLDRWNSDDLRYSRPSANSPSMSSGSVYVRGYTRMDGTYVAPHTRSAPHSHK